LIELPRDLARICDPTDRRRPSPKKCPSTRSGPTRHLLSYVATYDVGSTREFDFADPNSTAANSVTDVDNRAVACVTTLDLRAFLRRRQVNAC